MVVAHNDSRVTGRLFRREPSDVQCRLYRWFWMMAYLGVFAMKDFLPERFSRDAGTLAEMIEQNNFDEGSYGAMAMIYSHVPGPLLPLLPAIICIPSLWIILGYVRSYPVMMLMPILLMPYLIMNFMNPTKETLVALMILAVYHISQSRLTTFRAILLVLMLYGTYAAFIRSYYALIAIFFIALLFLRHMPRAIGAIAVLLGLAAMLMLPEDFYRALQGSRDESAFYMAYLGEDTVRTYFFNLLPPDNLGSFLVNTFWGLLVMFVPFFVAQSFNEVLMMVNVFMYCGMVLAILRYRGGAGQLPAYLFMGHILTQAQFEPDLGSYVRHFSSVLVMISPGLLYMFRNRPAEVIVAEETAQLQAAGGAPADTVRTTVR